MTTPSPDAKALAMEALRPFAEFATGWELGAHGSELADESTTRNSYMRLGDYRRARKALAALKQLQTPAPQPEELRGLIARMIDEGVWAKVKTVDGVVCIVYSGVEETAGRILQLLPPPEGYVVDWRPIESAPRDGTAIQVLFSDGSEDEVQWEEARYCMIGPPQGAFGPGWQDTLNCLPVAPELVALRWIPTPPPPSPEAQGEKL